MDRYLLKEPFPRGPVIIPVGIGRPRVRVPGRVPEAGMRQFACRGTVGIAVPLPVGGTDRGHPSRLVVFVSPVYSLYEVLYKTGFSVRPVIVFIGPHSVIAQGRDPSQGVIGRLLILPVPVSGLREVPVVGSVSVCHKVLGTDFDPGLGPIAVILETVVDVVRGR